MLEPRSFAPTPARTGYDPRRQCDFWNRAAETDVLIAIYDTPEVRGAGGIDAFARSGEETAAALAGFTHPDSTVLDLGCGIGRVLRPLAARSRRVFGIDVSTEMLARAKQYLAGLDNVSLHHTDGRTIPDVADGSVDFLYSLLCLIHVDRRTAFDYMGEIKRVLARDGCALLQFHDILTDLGLAKFKTVVGSDYPLEFYTELELRRLLGAHDLSVLGTSRHDEYVVLTVVSGSAETWLQRFTRDVQVAGLDRGGGLAPGRLDLSRDGHLTVRVQAAPNSRRTLRLRVDIREDSNPAEAIVEASVAVPLPAGTTTAVRISFTTRSTLTIDAGDTRLAEHTMRRPPHATSAVLNAALMPAELDWRSAAQLHPYALSERLS